eukprot:2670542-Prorocentrum_lima.AAC.1
MAHPTTTPSTCVYHATSRNICQTLPATTHNMSQQLLATTQKRDVSTTSLCNLLAVCTISRAPRIITSCATARKMRQQLRY